MDRLLLIALLGGCVGIGYLAAGLVLLHRRKQAAAPFVAFWVGIGAYALAEALWVLDGLHGQGGLAVALLVLQVKIVSIVAAFAGLVAYLVGVYTGSRAATQATLLAYVPVLVLVEWVYAVRQPYDVMAGTWGLKLVYAQPDVEPLWTTMLTLLLLPPTLAALAYLSLLRVAHDARLRRRIALTGGALVLFFVPMFLAWRAGGWSWWGPVEKVLGAATAILMLMAQTEGARERGLADERRARTREAQRDLARRARDLV